MSQLLLIASLSMVHFENLSVANHRAGAPEVLTVRGKHQIIMFATLICRIIEIMGKPSFFLLAVIVFVQHASN